VQAPPLLEAYHPVPLLLEAYHLLEVLVLPDCLEVVHLL
jgi:hypothetical protein